MRVLMETISRRKGYKDFENIEDFGDFMDKNGNKITNFRYCRKMTMLQSIAIYKLLPVSAKV